MDKQKMDFDGPTSSSSSLANVQVEMDNQEPLTSGALMTCLQRKGRETRVKMNEEKLTLKLSSHLKSSDKISSRKPPSEAHLKCPSTDLKTPGKRDSSHFNSSQQCKNTSSGKIRTSSASSTLNPLQRRHSLPTSVTGVPKPRTTTTRLLSTDQLPAMKRPREIKPANVGNFNRKRARKSEEEREADRRKSVAERRKWRMENPFDRPDKSQRRDWIYGRSAKGRKDFRQTYSSTFKDQIPDESSEDD